MILMEAVPITFRGKKYSFRVPNTGEYLEMDDLVNGENQNNAIRFKTMMRIVSDTNQTMSSEDFFNMMKSWPMDVTLKFFIEYMAVFDNLKKELESVASSSGTG